ncbi:MAG: glycoside hydrolase family 127 protein [Kiritimatiellae bacterium]|nr:glycoside hydrolase family 127 protein [Kiritimatiellia bacterium]
MMNGLTLLLAGALALPSVKTDAGRDFRRLDGAVGEKARRLFENRLLSPKARGDVFEETVRAFATNYDDRHPDPPGAKRHNGVWQGEYWGKTMLSHCAYARCTGDAEERDFIHRSALRLVESFQRADGYLGTYADADFIRGWNWNLWGRKYTMWALVEAYDLTNDARLLDAARKMAVHIGGQLKAQKVSIGETGCFAGLPSMSLLKPLVMLHRRTGSSEVRDLAEHILADNDRADGRCPNLVANAFTDKPLHAWYDNPLDWAKAYELMSVLEGFVEYAAAYGKKRPLEAVKRIFDKLAADELNGVCSVGYHDHFAGARAYPNAISESCDVVHWMRLCRFLYEATGETGYLDHWERAFLNAFMAGVFRDGRWGTHDVRSHGKRHLQGLFEVNMLYHFCCIANDPRGFCDYADVAFEEVSADRCNLNFFTDGEYLVKGVHVEVAGGYPVGDRVSVKVRTLRPVTVGLRVPADCRGLDVGGPCEALRESPGRLAVAVPAGETELSLSFDMPPRIESWRSDKPQNRSLDASLRDNFEMRMHNSEMVGFARETPGVRVFRGPMLLAKCMLVGDSDAEVFGDLGVDETWKASLAPRHGDGVWGRWDVTFEKGGERKVVGASDYQSAADFDSWQNSFSIWF